MSYISKPQGNNKYGNTYFTDLRLFKHFLQRATKIVI